jgi:glycosyltransferase involved in cell wall biosynthesis
MKELKVLHISETFAAGVYTYIKDICQFLEPINGVKTYVIYSSKRKDTNPEKFERDFSTSTTLIEIEMSREISPLKDFKALLKIAKKIKEIKPDVIHLHSSKAGIIGRIASKAYSKANIYYTPNGYSFVREDISDRKKKMFRTIEKYITIYFGGVTIACGDTEYEHAKKIGESLLVRNGVNINDVYSFKKTVPNKVFTIGTVGRLSSQKNPKLFNEIAERFPEINFIWIGDGELKHEITSKNIEIKGWMPREKVLELVSSFDIYIQTSLWEGLPFTIIEAMVLEKPIIAKNVIGNKDAVKKGYNGFLCTSLEEFITSINILKQNKKLTKEMEIHSGVRAKDLFDRDKNFKLLYQIYKSKLE